MTCDDPAFLILRRSLSISSAVISPSHTKKGAVVYSEDGSLNCDDKVVKSGTLTSLIKFCLQELRVIKPANKVSKTDRFITGIVFIEV